MRASNLIVALAATVGGLGAAAGAKALGLFSKPAPPPPPNVVVAARNLFPDDVLDGAAVQIRPMTPEEAKEHAAEPDAFLGSSLGAAFLRVPTVAIEADRPIRKRDLKELGKPDPLNSRLLPDTRAVSVAAMKEHAAGGLIVTGDWVDVNVTTSYTTAAGATGTRTVTVARQARVIAKRDSLVQSLQPQPDDVPIRFTLELNPYRAALVDFCREKGTISLGLLSKTEIDDLETRRTAALAGKGKWTFGDRLSKEFQDEDARVGQFKRGDVQVGERDLMRLLGLVPAEAPAPPVMVEVVSGGQRESRSFVETVGGFRDAPVETDAPRNLANAPNPAEGFAFSAPPARSDRPGAAPQGLRTQTVSISAKPPAALLKGAGK